MAFTALDAYNTMRTNYQLSIDVLEKEQIEKEAKEADLHIKMMAVAAKEEAIRIKKQELECLAATIYYEGANEPFEGQMAIAQVVLNRLHDPNYPKTICEVTNQKTEMPDGKVVYQFSWVGEEHDPQDVNPYTWEQAHYIAKKVLTNKVAHAKLASYNVEWYHNTQVDPHWNLVKFTQIGHHIFYTKA
jgi:spore germination cell wall hydrolase CwlJ-like protein